MDFSEAVQGTIERYEREGREVVKIVEDRREAVREVFIYAISKYGHGLMRIANLVQCRSTGEIAFREIFVDIADISAVVETARRKHLQAEREFSRL